MDKNQFVNDPNMHADLHSLSEKVLYRMAPGEFKVSYPLLNPMIDMAADDELRLDGDVQDKEFGLGAETLMAAAVVLVIYKTL